MLPPKKPDITPRPEIVDDVEYEATDVVNVSGRSFALQGPSDLVCMSQFGDGDEEEWESDEDEDDAEGDDGFGTGTTATTSKARLWLARWCVRSGDLERAERLAEELCMDGWEVEEAKGLVRDVRARLQLREVEEEGEMDD